MNEIHIFDRKLVKKRRERAAKNFSEHDFIINLASDYTIERLIDIGNKYELAFDSGCHTGGLGRKLTENNLAGNIIYSDLSATMVNHANGLKIIADEELLPFAPSSFDLIASTMSLHWVNDLPGALIQMRKCLKKNGMFIATMPGIETFKELRHCLMEAEIEITGGTAPHLSPFADVKTLGHLLQRAGFSRPVADSETIQVSYSDMFALLADLKNMGERNALIKRGNFIRRSVLKLAAEKYATLYPDMESGILASIEIITITAIAG